MLSNFDDFNENNLNFFYVNYLVQPDFKRLKETHKILAQELLEVFIKVLQNETVDLLTRKLLLSKFLDLNDKESILYLYDKLTADYKETYQKYFLEWQFNHNQEFLLDIYQADKQFRKVNNKRSRRQPEIKESNLESLIKTKNKGEQFNINEISPFTIMRIFSDGGKFPFG